MKRTSIAQARAELPTLVDAAEHDHRRTLITRGGRAVAAIVPVELALARRPRYTVEQIEALFGGFVARAPESAAPSAVETLLADRR